MWKRIHGLGRDVEEDPWIRPGRDEEEDPGIQLGCRGGSMDRAGMQRRIHQPHPAGMRRRIHGSTDPAGVLLPRGLSDPLATTATPLVAVATVVTPWPAVQASSHGPKHPWNSSCGFWDPLGASGIPSCGFWDPWVHLEFPGWILGSPGSPWNSSCGFWDPRAPLEFPRVDFGITWAPLEFPGWILGSPGNPWNSLLWILGSPGRLWNSLGGFWDHPSTPGIPWVDFGITWVHLEFPGWILGSPEHPWNSPCGFWDPLAASGISRVDFGIPWNSRRGFGARSRSGEELPRGSFVVATTPGSSAPPKSLFQQKKKTGKATFPSPPAPRHGSAPGRAVPAGPGSHGNCPARAGAVPAWRAEVWGQLWVRVLLAVLPSSIRPSIPPLSQQLLHPRQYCPSSHSNFCPSQSYSQSQKAPAPLSHPSQSQSPKAPGSHRPFPGRASWCFPIPKGSCPTLLPFPIPIPKGSCPTLPNPSHSQSQSQKAPAPLSRIPIPPTLPPASQKAPGSPRAFPGPLGMSPPAPSPWPLAKAIPGAGSHRHVRLPPAKKLPAISVPPRRPRQALPPLP
ncbi:PREDICTED: uncharacterized protein LOC108449331 [Corvus brachyrhynchos]|uniref:uncharacterized protein LOC108449331 n=1 Tax=Corvus brachyrhynchos TaxID=85066 RepID=UPI0008164B77|nr:PREDICTED: uncharacterized protein LOC108449331 [Corvus brachyrhynchos]